MLQTTTRVPGIWSFYFFGYPGPVSGYPYKIGLSCKFLMLEGLANIYDVFLTQYSEQLHQNFQGLIKVHAQV